MLGRRDVAYFFVACAVLGGTVMVCQLLMTFLGLASHMDLSADHHVDLGGGHDAGDSAHGSHGHGAGSTWWYGLISLRTLVAGLTFFGLAGMTSLSAGGTAFFALLPALAAGALSMLALHRVLAIMSRLRADGTMRIERACGLTGTVYIPIPPEKSGAGKVQLRMGDRIVELKAFTNSSLRLPTGAMVVVTAVLNHDTVQVEPADRTPRIPSTMDER
ncbi:MAG TPA: hypothetical protein VIY86_05335 [Pirellulaceae bacterium]